MFIIEENKNEYLEERYIPEILSYINQKFKDLLDNLNSLNETAKTDDGKFKYFDSLVSWKSTNLDKYFEQILDHAQQYVPMNSLTDKFDRLLDTNKRIIKAHEELERGAQVEVFTNRGGSPECNYSDIKLSIEEKVNNLQFLTEEAFKRILKLSISFAN